MENSSRAILLDLQKVEVKLGYLKSLLILSEGRPDEHEVQVIDLVDAAKACRTSGVEVHNSVDIWLVNKSLDSLELVSPEFAASLTLTCGAGDTGAELVGQYSISKLNGVVDEFQLCLVQRKVI